MLKVREDADNWTSCAIGERDKQMRHLLRDNGDAVNLSKKAASLGLEFTLAVSNGESEKALSILRKIEKLKEKEFYS